MAGGGKESLGTKDHKNSPGSLKFLLVDELAAVRLFLM